MHCRPCLFAVALCLVVGGQQLHGEESLRNSKTVRKLSKREQLMFGPKSQTLKYDSRMIRAAEIARKRARPKTTWRCWRYVKDALLAANVISTRPRSVWAKQAGAELCRRFGFVRIPVTNPFDAPIGAVIVYGGTDAGHVELRTADGFVSDFVSTTPYPRPLIGVYVKGPA